MACFLSNTFLVESIIDPLLKWHINLSHASAKTESENNRRAAQGTITELHQAAH